MNPSKEQSVWDNWNSARVKDGLIGERLGLCDTAVNAVLALDLAQGTKLLDVGCGAGWTSERLNGKFDYLGLDFSEQAIAAARLRMPQTRFEAADFLSWEAPSNHYDVVLCVDTIAVIRDQDKVIEKIAHSLKEGGWLVITTVNPFCYSRLRRIGPPKEGQFRNWLTKPGLHNLITRHNFEIKKSWTILPAGDMGILRFVNSSKLNSLPKALFGARRLQLVKESMGLGQFRIVVARLRSR